jgi:hypothetical protein
VTTPAAQGSAAESPKSPNAAPRDRARGVSGTHKHLRPPNTAPPRSGPATDRWPSRSARGPRVPEEREHEECQTEAFELHTLGHGLPAEQNHRDQEDHGLPAGTKGRNCEYVRSFRRPRLTRARWLWLGALPNHEGSARAIETNTGTTIPPEPSRKALAPHPTSHNVRSDFCTPQPPGWFHHAASACVGRRTGELSRRRRRLLATVDAGSSDP